MDIQTAPKKGHNAPKSGRKAVKKRTKKATENPNTEEARKRNPKAYALKSAVKAERQFRHKQDLLEKRHHVPLVDRTPTDPPPIVVAIIGPPGSGKSILMRNLIKHFSRQTLTRLSGPITVVCGKKRRVTFIECENDINCMIDVAKIADLALLLVDASYGFEMDTFEFLNICQVHGFPRIMGVLTHLDLIKSAKTLKRTKKVLKHRFWTEIYQGAKLFYLSSLVKGNYPKNEIKNLARFISVMKFRPLVWRTTHPYLLVDRIEDITPEHRLHSAPEENRTICLFGYARGSFFKEGQSVHIPGCGDFHLKEVSCISDPCPIPKKEEQKKRSLNEKEKLIYAPFSGVGGLVYDRDAVYIDLKGSHSHNEQSMEPEDVLLNEIMATDEPIDTKMATSAVQLFSSTQFGRDENTSESESEENDMETDQEVSSDENEETPMKLEDAPQSSGGEKFEFDDDEDDDHDLLQPKDSNWKECAAEKAHLSFYERQASTNNIQKLIYGPLYQLVEDKGSDDDPMFTDGLVTVKSKKVKTQTRMDNTFDSVECTKPPFIKSQILPDMISNSFVTGTWDSAQDAKSLLTSEPELFGDFEDLEKNEAIQEEEGEGEDLAQKKLRLKEAFDASYDGQKEEKTFYDELKEEAEHQAKVGSSFTINIFTKC